MGGGGKRWKREAYKQANHEGWARLDRTHGAGCCGSAQRDERDERYQGVGEEQDGEGKDEKKPLILFCPDSIAALRRVEASRGVCPSTLVTVVFLRRPDRLRALVRPASPGRAVSAVSMHSASSHGMAAGTAQKVGHDSVYAPKKKGKGKERESRKSGAETENS